MNAKFQGEIVLIIQSIGKISTFSVGLTGFCLFVCFLVDCKIDAIIYMRIFYFNAFLCATEQTVNPHRPPEQPVRTGQQ